MHTVNRTLAVLKPKQAYVDWINALPGPASNMTLEKLAQDQTCYLIPEYDTVERTRSHRYGVRPIQVRSGCFPEKNDSIALTSTG